MSVVRISVMGGVTVTLHGNDAEEFKREVLLGQAMCAPDELDDPDVSIDVGYKDERQAKLELA